tara:strand:- start:1125 stop:2423 length:1299 start_codon:yes stop_codon:yes gene_type:complete
MKLILLELNEINFDVVKYYIDKGISLPAMNHVLESGLINTSAESEYDNLEPWIQWVSVHTGKEYNEHNVFRLGDFVNSKEEQFFEKVEKAGFNVGAISPMNAANRLKNPSYFIPDPWTQTKTDKSFLSRIIAESLAQSVNDNSQSRLTVKTILSLILAFFIMVNPKKYFFMLKYAFQALGKPWRKALFLDMFLYEIHKTLFKNKKPNFSTLFLNAGAHIQHHYFFNSPYVNSKVLKNPDWYIDKNEDPILEMLVVYDRLIGDLIKNSETELIIATGLSQKPFTRLKFYYRLKDHKEFLDIIGIKYASVTPRMTRDFLISFKTPKEAAIAKEKLSSITLRTEKKLFEEIDNRGKDIFVVLTYPFEITRDTYININGNEICLYDHVVFVAIKNGEHNSKGFSYFSKGLTKFRPEANSHVLNINKTVLNYFGVKN